MGQLILLLYGNGDVNGTHLTSCHLFAHEFKNLGFEVQIQKVADADDLHRLIKIFQERDVFCTHVEQAQLINMNVNGTNVFEYFNIPICSQIRDHYFYPWLLPNLAAAHEKSVFIHTDATFDNARKLFKGKHYLGLHTAQNISSSFEEPIRVNDQPIFVGTAYNIDRLINEFKFEFSHLSQVADMILEDTYQKCEVPGYFWKAQLLDDKHLVLCDEFQLSFTEYFKLFELARFRIRHNFLSAISATSCNIFVKGDWEPSENVAATISKGFINKFEAQRLVASSPCSLSDQAGFRDAVGERVSTALLTASPVIMRKAPLNEYFISAGVKSFQNYNELTNLLQHRAYLDMNHQISEQFNQVPLECLPGAYVRRVVCEISKFVCNN